MAIPEIADTSTNSLEQVDDVEQRSIENANVDSTLMDSGSLNTSEPSSEEQVNASNEGDKANETTNEGNSIDLSLAPLEYTPRAPLDPPSSVKGGKGTREYKDAWNKAQEEAQKDPAKTNENVKLQEENDGNNKKRCGIQ